MGRVHLYSFYLPREKAMNMMKVNRNLWLTKLVCQCHCVYVCVGGGEGQGVVAFRGIKVKS